VGSAGAAEPESVEGIATASPPALASGSDILGTVSDDPATDAVRDRRADQRRRRVAVAGHRGDLPVVMRGLRDPDQGVRAAAVGALARLGELRTPEAVRALADGAAEVRRRTVEVAPGVRGPGSRSVLTGAVRDALGDEDPLVVVGAAWFLGERRAVVAVPALTATATGHDDVRCREAAVAALGAIGAAAGLPAVLAALDDKATVRRRAVVALAGFDDPRVEAAWRRAAQDRDWQVRQAAEELLGTG
jgi:HEAT repeat protein